jgi:alkylation response protein AidB-like acyl-CoA dehydrogenase
VDFGLSEEQSAFKKSVYDFAKKELASASAEPKTTRERDKVGGFFREGFDKCAEFGILALPVPEQYGGLGKDVVDCALAMQALGRGCTDSGLLFTISSHVFTCEIPLLQFGSEEQKQRFLPRMVKGELIGCHAMSEPEAGSDAFSLTTSAEKRGDRFVLNGTKTFITNAPIADVLIVFASTGGQKRGFGGGLTAFLVPTSRPGVHVGRPLRKLGLRTAPMAEVCFEDVELDDGERLGKKGGGAAIFSSEMEWERSCLFACHLGAMERQLERCIRYARDRTQFGQAIGKFQAVSHRIANMKVRIELGRQMLHKVAWLKDRGERAVMEAAVAKLYVSEAYVQSSLDAVAIHGGYGYMAEYEVERDLRDAIGSKIYSGTNEIQKNIIASLLGL